ncbi:MAG: glycosyltransferase family 4 protein [Verrucomicrobiota bacterium]
MNIVQITPGAGGMYCGNCFRDNALVAALRQQGHSTLMVPLYLPMTLEETDSSAGTPIFYGGISVYLDQKSAWYRHAPKWLHGLLDSPLLLKLASGRAAKTRAEDVGELTISMLRGEEGNQARELEELIAWLKTQPHPDIICLSNAMLLGLARRLKAELHSAVVCMLQGEDYFIDSMPKEFRDVIWQTMAARAQQVDAFIAPSRYFGERMAERLKLPPESVRVVPNGINLDGYAPAPQPPDPPVLGYFARMCPEKGLDVLVGAFISLKHLGHVKNLKLRVGGGCGPGDEPFVQKLRDRLEELGMLKDVEFCPNLDRHAKQEFFRSLSVMSVPATYGEAFGLYVIEALAAGVPVVQPDHAAFPELIEATGGGVTCKPRDPQALADALEPLLLDPARARALGEQGRRVVLEKYGAASMVANVLSVYHAVVDKRQPATAPR